MRSRNTRHAAIVALIAGLAVIAAGCGSKGPSTTTGQSAQSNQQDGVSQAYAFSRCMRSHGLPNFPDPKVSVGQGHTSVGIAVNPSETSSPKFNSAQKACQGILPTPNGHSAQHSGPSKQVLLAFARCMRSKGIQAFPDPDAQGQLRLPAVIAAGVDIHSHQFLDAATSCVGVTHGQITAAQIRAGVNGAQ
jgi:hypothetical protein